MKIIDIIIKYLTESGNSDIDDIEMMRYPKGQEDRRKNFVNPFANAIEHEFWRIAAFAFARRFGNWLQVECLDHPWTETLSLFDSHGIEGAAV